MTLRLILTRHAKSSWDHGGLDDHSRPLNARGQRSAVALGQWIAAQGLAPSLVLSSDSARTRETWDLIAPALDKTPRLDWDRMLYLASATTIMTALQGALGRTVLILGHNPGIARFAGQIVGEAPDHPRFVDYPTGATTVVSFETESWSTIDWGMGRVEGFVIPRELPES